jgi:hypothetical protein
MMIPTCCKEAAYAVLPARVINCIQSVRRVVRQRLLGYEIGEKPFLDEIAYPAFVGMLTDSSRYLEYGSGGSTVMAARQGKALISVDTDRFFLKAVQKKIGKLSPNQHLLWGDIGATGPWGAPKAKPTSEPSRRIEDSYIELPWRYVERCLLPDLVMIDGRFRVAAALFSCAQLVNDPQSRVVVDDYVVRPEYKVIEQHAQLLCTIGNMAIFKPPQQNSPQLQETINSYLNDCR